MNQPQMSTVLLGALLAARGQVVNTDSDGLISALLLARLAALRETALPVIGFYDNERLWLSPDLPLSALIDDPKQVIFVDADVRLPGAVVVSQHVVHDVSVEAIAAPPVDVVLINPNYLDVAHGRSYRRKYPFSTAAWVWSLAPQGLPVLGPGTHLLTGLLWAQDGGHESVAEDKHRANCIEWATEMIDDFPLASAAHALRGLAADARVGEYRRDDAIVARAKAAEAEIRRLLAPSVGARAGWRSQQWCFAARQRSPIANPASDAGRHDIQRFLDAAAEVIGVPSVSVEPLLPAARGTWREVHLHRDEVEWDSAFSLAKTYQDRVACTLDLHPWEDPPAL